MALTIVYIQNVSLIQSGSDYSFAIHIQMNGNDKIECIFVDLLSVRVALFKTFVFHCR